MSWDIFLTTASEKLKISKYRILEKVEKFVESSGLKFNENKYEELLKGMSVDEKIIIEELIRLGLIDKKVLCECLLFEESNLLNETEDKCNRCGGSIRDNNHESIDYYSLDGRDIDHILNLKIEYAKIEYIPHFSKGIFTDLVENKDNIIPFVGSGVSIPLELPSWGGMIRDLTEELEEPLRPAYERYIKNGSYLKALSYLEDNSTMDKDQIKERIIKEFDKVPKSALYSNDSNYSDLYRLKSNFYITTNYDNLLTDYISNIDSTVSIPYTWKDLVDLQTLIKEDKKRVFHIHGHIQRADTMIVTLEDYNRLYEKDEIKNQLTGIMSAKNLLFIGFSFNDEFFKQLYKEIISSIKGKHYIILPNTTIEKIKEINKEAPGLRCIGINVQTNDKGLYVNQDFVNAIRTVLQHIN